MILYVQKCPQSDASFLARKMCNKGHKGSSFKNSSPRGDKNSNPNPNLKDHQNTINNLKLQQGCLHLCKVRYTHTYCSYKVWWSLIQLQLFYIIIHIEICPVSSGQSCIQPHCNCLKIQHIEMLMLQNLFYKIAECEMRSE